MFALVWEGEAPAEPLVPDSVHSGQRLRRSFALPGQVSAAKRSPRVPLTVRQEEPAASAGRRS